MNAYIIDQKEQTTGIATDSTTNMVVASRWLKMFMPSRRAESFRKPK